MLTIRIDTILTKWFFFVNSFLGEIWPFWETLRLIKDQKTKKATF
jgi:hypothetical protein